MKIEKNEQTQQQSTEKSEQIAAPDIGAKRRGRRIAAELAKCAVFVVLMVVAAKISIPFYPVALTFQTVVAVLAGLLLGPKYGSAAMAVYVFIGLIGLPVFTSGGGFVYVAAMHDSFPQALELSRNGYNAFALIYRPGAQTACEDLARAIAFLHNHAEELEIDMADYSLWGGSAGARMAAWLGSYGTQSFGEQEYPRPAAVIMQYTGLSEVTGNEPPTYNCVGTRDGIASYRIMEDRISRIKEQGTDAEIQVFEGLHHGFGLGEGTTAEGWINRAIAFWERQM